MNPRIGFALVLGVLLASSVLRAASTPSKALLVLAKRDRTLAIVDPSTLKAVARIPVGPDPHEVMRTLTESSYASNYGGGAYHTLAMVDLEGQKALPPVDLGPLGSPHDLGRGRQGLVYG